MHRLLLVIAAALLVSACASAPITPARYSTLPANTSALQRHDRAALKLNSMIASGEIDVQCRLQGPIPMNGATGDPLSLPQFVAQAFNEEFRQAGIYSDHGVKLSGKLTLGKLGSSQSLSDGRWQLALTLTSSNTRWMTANVSHDFQTALDSGTVCERSAAELVVAVQKLIASTVTSPSFATLAARGAFD